MARYLRLSFVLIAVGLLTSLLPAFSATQAVSSPDTAPMAIKGGSIVLKVKDYGEARARVMRLADAHYAQLHKENSEANFTGERHGEIVLELDSAQLGPLMEQVRGIGKLYSEMVQTSDQTSNYQKLGTRISLLKQNEGELLGFLHSPRRMRGSDILFVQSRLYDSRVQSANVAQERVDIARRSQRATLSVSLFEPEPRKIFDWGNWRAVASYRAKGSFLYVARKAVTGFFFVLYFAPIWIPAALILFFVGRKLIRVIRHWANVLLEKWRVRQTRQ